MFNQSFTLSGSSVKLLKPGERGVVVKINTPDYTMQQKLKSIGVVPGAMITVEQSFPRRVIRVGQDRFALDDPTLNAIYVRTNPTIRNASKNHSLSVTTVRRV